MHPLERGKVLPIQGSQHIIAAVDIYCGYFFFDGIRWSIVTSKESKAEEQKRKKTIHD